MREDDAVAGLAVGNRWRALLASLPNSGFLFTSLGAPPAPSYVRVPVCVSALLGCMAALHRDPVAFWSSPAAVPLGRMESASPPPSLLPQPHTNTQPVTSATPARPPTRSMTAAASQRTTCRMVPCFQALGVLFCVRPAFVTCRRTLGVWHSLGWHASKQGPVPRLGWPNMQ